jgi:hypothetical protein
LVLGRMAILATLQGPTTTGGPDKWLRFFRAFPGARELCRQQIPGHARGRPVEIHFTLYATEEPPAEVARFYARTHEVPLDPGGDSITVRSADGRKVLSVLPVSASHRECGVKPEARDRTIIVASARGSLERAR